MRMTDKHKRPKASPTPAEIRQLRLQVGLTQKAAAEKVCSTARRWIEWEGGVHKMHPGLWMLFQIRTKAALKRGRPPVPSDT